MLATVPSVPPRIPGLTQWRPIARGGFATVWEAKQESLNRMVAVKVDQRRLDDESEKRRFLREAGAAGRMSGHAGIVTVHDAGILPDDRPYLIMDLCPGGSLTKWLPESGRRTPSEVREVGVRIADALAAAHARGVLHRDVKPANIMIDAYGHAGLADFGLAALPDPGLELSETVEAITPAYAPPEAFRKETPTEFGDVYSLAATLYAMLHGQSPHPTEDSHGQTFTVARLVARRSEPIEPIPGVDPDFMALLLDAMVETPSERPTAVQFRDRLAALDLDPPAADTTTAQSRRRPVLLVVAALLIACLATAVIAIRAGGAGQRSSSRSPRRRDAGAGGPIDRSAVHAGLPARNARFRGRLLEPIGRHDLLLLRARMLGQHHRDHRRPLGGHVRDLRHHAQLPDVRGRGAGPGDPSPVATRG